MCMLGGGGSILILSFNMGFHSILIVDFSIPSYIQHAGVKFFQSDDEEEEEEGDEEEEKQQPVISVPPVVKADKECWTQEPEFDKYVCLRLGNNILLLWLLLFLVFGCSVIKTRLNISQHCFSFFQHF